jgi:hypothetical protein
MFRTAAFFLAFGMMAGLPGSAQATFDTRPTVKPITWFPSAQKDWDVLGVVKGYQQATPSKVRAELAAAKWSQLADAHAVAFEQEIDDGLGRGKQWMLVEVTQGLVNLPLEAFLARLPAARWGVSLDHYLGGQVKIFSRDAGGRVVYQLERMSLSALPLNLSTPISDLDMTKVEHILYEPDRATVYWRVMYSNNRTTLSDVGTVSFIRSGNMTKVVFHSAHRLASPLGPIPNWMLKGTIKSFFSDHVRRYRKLVTR